METSKTTLRRDGQDIVVVDLTLLDKKGRYVPDACDEISISVEGDAEILGWGNGDPGYKAAERPQNADKKHARLNAFMGNAQFILRGVDAKSSSPVTVAISLAGKTKLLLIDYY